MPNGSLVSACGLWCKSTTDLCTTPQSSSSSCIYNPPPVFLPSGAMRSVLQALTVRTVKVCVTVRTVRAATTSTEAACASRASAGHTAGTGCVRPVNTACTVSAPVSARTNTHSGEWVGVVNGGIKAGQTLLWGSAALEAELIQFWLEPKRHSFGKVTQRRASFRL